MNLAKVIGTVVCTIKDPSLTGKKILLIRPVDRIGDSCGPVKVAIDSMGAGPGEFVFYVTGKEAAFYRDDNGSGRLPASAAVPVIPPKGIPDAGGMTRRSDPNRSMA